MVSDRVGDFIIRLKNAGAIGNPMVTVPHSKHLEAIANKLKELGFVERVEISKKTPAQIEVTLSYDARGNHKITDVKRVSKPGRRMYVSSSEAHSVKNGMGARIISTPKGILTDKEARKVKAGGENLFEIW
ncbi:MAG TPA: 30S ribosomal protein S8 [Candidatus Paceibacterota bacterium]|jgi:small subunit ribosomal protein S8|nr:30S ribosomal protein S8 [Candidatus Paceibacterota bacterium]